MKAGGAVYGGNHRRSCEFISLVILRRSQILPCQIFTFLFKYTYDQSNAKIDSFFDISYPDETGGMKDFSCVLTASSFVLRKKLQARCRVIRSSELFMFLLHSLRRNNTLFERFSRPSTRHPVSGMREQRTKALDYDSFDVQRCVKQEVLNGNAKGSSAYRPLCFHLPMPPKGCNSKVVFQGWVSSCVCSWRFGVVPHFLIPLNS